MQEWNDKDAVHLLVSGGRLPLENDDGVTPPAVLTSRRSYPEGLHSRDIRKKRLGLSKTSAHSLQNASKKGFLNSSDKPILPE